MERVRLAAQGAALLVLLTVGSPVAGQSPAPPSAGGPDTTVVPGAHYRAGGLHTFFFGRHYRDLWTTPIRVPVLDLDTFAGGLRPTERGGGKQTRSLRFKGGDGREYQFRSVDKDPSPLLPPELRQTVARRVFQDQISAGHPAAPLVVSPVLTAAGVLHSRPQLVLMPDSPGLGQFRDDFGGLLGTLEERQTDHGAGFAGADKIISTEELFDRLEEHQEERVDARGYLTARLVDVFLGDWDRHQDQWRWARLTKGDSIPWTPIPRDRDQAFARFDGLLLGLARLSAPQLVEFSGSYPSMVGLTWNARVVDRRLLSGLGWPTWDSAATELQGRLTDAVIDSAVAKLPAEFQPRNAAWLAAALKQRRNALPRAARRFYEILAHEVEVTGSDKADRVVVDHPENGVVDVAVYPTSGDTPTFRRRFERHDTREVRMYLHGDDDAVLVRGDAGGGPLVRVIGGGGSDRVVDSSRAGRTRFYDARGTNEVGGSHHVPLDTRPYQDFRLSDSTPYPRRDWGGFWRFRPWLTSAPDIGLFLGGGVVRYNFGFRKQPYASKLALRAGYATSADRFRAEFFGDFRRVNSRVRTSLFLRASGIEVVRFFGFGNETPRVTDDDEFYRVPQEQYLVTPAVTFPVGGFGALTLGPTLKYVDTDARPGRFLAVTPVPGTGRFGEVGGTAGFEWDTRDGPVATRGMHFTAGGTVYPALWDVESTFGELHGEASTYLTPRSSFAPTLALRAGAKKVWGDFPFFESAFVGGASTVRGLREQRYAGDAAVYGNAELRLPLGHYFVVLPGEFGVFGLADVGRVYLEGESSDTWHSGVGGGVWFAFLNRANTVSVAVVSGDDRTALYLKAGFGY